MTCSLAHPRVVVVSCLVSAALASCGSGTFGIFSATDSSSSSGNAPPTLQSFRVEDARESPARERRDAARARARERVCEAVAALNIT